MLISWGSSSSQFPFWFPTAIQSNGQFYGYQNAGAYTDNTCINQGADGSSALSDSWLRIVSGPLTTVGPVSSLPCSISPAPLAAKSTELFSRFYLDTSFGAAQLNASLFVAKGLPPQRYWGAQDKNGNFVLDVQEDLEASGLTPGEAGRDFFAFDWASRHKNASWKTFGATVIYPDQLVGNAPPYGIVHLESGTVPLPYFQSDAGVSPPVTGSPYSETLLRYDTLPLQASTTYRVGLNLNTFSASGVIQVALGASTPVQIPTLLGSRKVYFRVTTGASATCALTNPSNCGLRIDAINPGITRTQPLVSADLTTLTIVRESVSRDFVMDFDDSDKRMVWTNESRGTRALFLPDGRLSTPNGVPDWALALNSDSDWGASTDGLALVPSDSYTIYFRTRSSAGTLFGNAQVLGPTGTVLAQNMSWSSTPVWGAEIAVGPFTVPSGGARLRFGRSVSSSLEHILIDEVRVHRN
jgi:hypothetical protein